MTYEEALREIKPLKNKYGQYEFWVTVQEGFFPASGRHTNALEALRMAISQVDLNFRANNEDLMSFWQNSAWGQGVATPDVPRSSYGENVDQWAVKAIAAMYQAGKIYKRMSLTWHGIKAPSGQQINNPPIEFSGRSAIGALKSLAIEHRRSSKNLEAHRHGVPNFIYNLRNIMEQFFGFASGMTDNQFVSQLVHAQVLQVTALDNEANLEWVIE